MQGVRDHRRHRAFGQPRAPTPPRRDPTDTFDAFVHEAAPPRPHRRVRRRASPRHLIGRHPLSRQQQRPGLHHLTVRQRTRTGHQPQHHPLLIRHRQRLGNTNRHQPSVDTVAISSTDHRASDKSGEQTSPARQFGTIRRLPSGRYQARYWHLGDQVSAGTTFATKTAARAWLSSVETDLRRGDHVDPRAGTERFGTYARRWLDEPRSPAAHQGHLRTPGRRSPQTCGSHPRHFAAGSLAPHEVAWARAGRDLSLRRAQQPPSASAGWVRWKQPRNDLCGRCHLTAGRNALRVADAARAPSVGRGGGVRRWRRRSLGARGRARAGLRRRASRGQRRRVG